MTRKNLSLAIVCCALLIAAAATPAMAAGPKNLIKMWMLNTGADPDAWGKVKVVINPAQTFFQIKVKGLTPPGPYDVVVNGAVVDTITVNAAGEGKVRYRSKNKGKGAGVPLPYDPRGASVEIHGSSTVYLTCVVPATPAESGEKVEIEVELTNSGVQPTASARAEFEARFGHMEFEVEMTGAVPGTYDLFVGGVDVGDIVVGATGEGEIEFDSRPCTDDDDGGLCDDLEELLTFDPLGQTVEIKEQVTGTVLFSGTIPLT